ncbi:MAG: AmmeMemoRadiSam system radical SAM enzyme [Candidatus Micrarchaeia archaeon]
MIKEAILWDKLPGEKVECIACARRCKIPEGSHGYCFVRQNIKGALYLINYGVLEAIQLDPIEKKPFNHFMPGSYVLGVGTSSCNWGCTFCQNHNISKEREVKGIEKTPEEIVELAMQNGAQGIAYTYNEPTIFIEYALDTARLAHENGLYNVFVTNGYETEEAVEKMKGLIDAAVVDFKGSGEQKFLNKYSAVPSADPVKKALVEMKKAGIHIELTDLIVPSVGDSLDACDSLTKWIHENLGPDTPIHFTRFYPDYKLLELQPTEFDTLKAHYDIARKNGLNYVYIGNVPGNPYESTYCPKCGELLIERDGFYITKWKLTKDNRCPKCHTRIPIVGKKQKEFRYEGITTFY